MFFYKKIKKEEQEIIKLIDMQLDNFRDLIICEKSDLLKHAEFFKNLTENIIKTTYYQKLVEIGFVRNHNWKMAQRDLYENYLFICLISRDAGVMDFIGRGIFMASIVYLSDMMQKEINNLKI